MQWSFSLGAAAVAVVVLAAAAGSWWGRATAAADQAHRALSGFWTAPADFCMEAGVAGMQFLVGAPRRDGTRLAHLAALNAGGQPVADTFAVLTCGRARRDGEWVRIPARVSAEKQSLFPAKVDLLVDPGRGRLRVHGQQKVWAVLERDAAASQALG